MEEFLLFVARSPLAEALKSSRYVYPIVNAVHIMALAALFGSILALDLRLMGFFKSIPVRPLALYLPRIAAIGLVAAVPTGIALFSVEPLDYAANPAFFTKITLVLIGSVHAIRVHTSTGWRNLVYGTGAIGPKIRVSAALSLVIWTAAILAGRFIAF